MEAPAPSSKGGRRRPGSAGSPLRAVRLTRRRSPEARTTATGPAPALGPQSQPPYLAVECTVSTLRAAGAAPPFSLAPHTSKRGISTSPSGAGGSSPSRQAPCLSVPRGHGGRGGYQPQPQGRLWAQRAASGASDQKRVWGGGGNPRVSQSLPEEGARFGSSAGPGTQRGRATRACTHAPSPGPREKKRRGSHTATLPSLPEQSQVPAGGGGGNGRLLEETEAGSQMCRRAASLLRGPRPSAWEAPRREGAQHLWLHPSEPRGAPSPPPTRALPKLPGRAVLPPGLRPKGLGFRLLGADFLPPGERSQGFAAGPAGADRSRGEGARRPLLAQGSGSAPDPDPGPDQAPHPSPAARIPRPESTEPAFHSPHPLPRMLTWRGGPGPCPGPRGFGIGAPGRPRLGLGLPAGLGCVPGWGEKKRGAGRDGACPPSPRPPLLSSPCGREGQK